MHQKQVRVIARLSYAKAPRSLSTKSLYQDLWNVPFLALGIWTPIFFFFFFTEALSFLRGLGAGDGGCLY